ncbi:energy-coupling factor transporter transmembrane component T [Treponema pectinovorum]|uniref:energy-coupling factor transporter transmembrane component T n=1 Tax=Treponema pectinovorum TaxID=164 RepID=UPI0011C977B2|nr:energy-coupling factor transporter transmembrane component T [Treponema pectinovorum]
MIIDLTIKKMNSIFKKCTHPVVDFLWFFGVISFSIFIRHPFYSILSLFCAVTFNLVFKNFKALKVLPFLIIMFIFLSALNPLVSHWGETVLFTIFGKPFTKEAFFYGLNMGLTFALMIEWFICFGTVMTSEKITALFSAAFPKLALMIVMILRLIPFCLRRTQEILQSRKGLNGSNLPFKESFFVLNAVMSSILEDGIMTALTMEKRGYGSAKRTHFINYRWRKFDIFKLAIFFILAIFIICGIKYGFCAVNFYPTVSASNIFATSESAISFFCFVVFIFFPVFERIFDELRR